MSKVPLFFSIAWVLTLLYGEMFVFWLPPIWSCSWPHLHNQVNVTNPDDYVKIAVVADPQLMDRTSLRVAPKSLALEIAQFYTDLYMRRAMLSSVLPFKPDVILFLGDYFDGGPFLSDEEWQESLNRFRHIFNLNMLQRTTNIKIYYISGNHDIGYAAFHSQMPEVIRRYEKEFGARNFWFTLGKVHFIAIDAQAVDGHSQEKPNSSTWDFVRDFSQNVGLAPRVLLTHIPLYRPDWTSCGPHRSSPIVNQRIHRTSLAQEIIYQNYIMENSTNDLLNLIKPALVLSGHDHDHCTVTHKFKEGYVQEHTLGTISWQQGNLYPSFMLLSASSHTGFTSEDAISTRLCFLPNQTYIYIWYIFLLATTILITLFPSNEIRFLRQFGDLMGNASSLISSSILTSVKKEKNEDDECEYEMIWDAEGTMHLIKSNSENASTPSKERVSVERGNAVMRSAAKKQSIEDRDVSIPIDVNANVGSVAPRTTKSKTRSIIRRLLRTFRVMFMVAAINVPLYMMLLFKDWVDK